VRWSWGARGRVPRFARATGDLVLLPDAGLVGEPDLYRLAAALGLGDLRQAGGEVLFLNASSTSGSCS
jgi:hypothetical protein